MIRLASILSALLFLGPKLVESRGQVLGEMNEVNEDNEIVGDVKVEHENSVRDRRKGVDDHIAQWVNDNIDPFDKLKGGWFAKKDPSKTQVYQRTFKDYLRGLLIGIILIMLLLTGLAFLIYFVYRKIRGERAAHRMLDRVKSGKSWDVFNDEEGGMSGRNA